MYEQLVIITGANQVMPWWRPIAWIQNLFFPSAAYMANNYFEKCTSPAFLHTTGKLINDKLEIMQAAPKEIRSLHKQLKQIIGSSVYPLYTENIKVKEQFMGTMQKTY